MDQTVTLTVDEYEDLLDTREAALAAVRQARGETELFTEEQVDAYLNATTPLAFWRRHRGFTQAELAAKAGITQPYLAQIEGGARTGAIDVYAQLARALRTRIDDLVSEVPFKPR